MIKNEPNNRDSLPSSGVEALIRRLKGEGVEIGKSQAEQIILEANKKAEEIIYQAEKQANSIVKKAQAEAEVLKTSGKDALQLAARDTLLKFKHTLKDRFSDEVRRLVGKVMKPDAFMQRLILEVAHRARDEYEFDNEEHITIQLPKDVIGLDELRRHPEELKEGTLSHFVLSIMADLLSEGVAFQASEDQTGGLRIKLENNDIVIDLTDEAIAAVLLEHLQPRFRALLEGIVK